MKVSKLEVQEMEKILEEATDALAHGQAVTTLEKVLALFKMLIQLIREQSDE